MKQRINLKIWLTGLMTVLVCAGVMITLKPCYGYGADWFREIKEDQKLPEEYTFAFAFTSQTRAEAFGVDDELHSFVDPDQSRAIVTQALRAETQKGKIGIRYTHVGMDGKESLDLIITLMDWEESGKIIYDKQTRKPVPACVVFYEDQIGMEVNGVNHSTFRYQLVRHDSQKTVSRKGHMTLKGMANGNGICVKDPSGIKEIWIQKDNEHLVFQKDTLKSRKEKMEDTDKDSWITVLYQDSFTLRVDTPGAKGKKQILRKRQEDGMLILDSIQISSESLGGSRITKDLKERVGTVGSTWEQAQAGEKKQPYAFSEYESFEYQIRHTLTGNQMDSYVLKDQLDPCLSLDSQTPPKVTDRYGNEVTDQFLVEVQGQQVSCQGKAEAMKKDSFGAGETYTLHLVVHRKSKGEVEQAHFQEDGFTFLIGNNASLLYQETGEKVSSVESGECTVSSQMLCAIEMEQKADYEQQSNEIMDYSLVIRQTREDAFAVNLTVEELSLPQGLELLGKATVSGGENTKIQEEGDNGWKLTCHRLDYGEYIVVAFQCKIAENVNGQELSNTVTARADNLSRISRDTQEVWVNSPQLKIQEQAAHYEWQVGEGVEYQVLVTNTVPQTVAKNLTISCASLPEGLVLEDGKEVTLEGVSDQISYPKGDQKTGIAVDQKKNQWSVTEEEDGFVLKLSYLPWDQMAVLRFRCIATEEGNGEELTNIVCVEANNGEEVKDDEKIFVNTPRLELEKTADTWDWKEGEPVLYQMILENKSTGTMARNLTVEQIQLPVNLVLQDQPLVDGVPGKVRDPVEWEQDVPNQLDEEKEQDTRWKTVEWSLKEEEAGWKLNISELPSDQKVLLTFPCQAEHTCEGETPVEEACAQTDCQPLLPADTSSEKGSGMLTLREEIVNENLKENDQRLEQEFRVGETIEYLLTIQNLEPDSVAHNLILTDHTLPDGLRLVPGEDGIQCEYQEGAYEIERQGNGFTIQIPELPDQETVTVRCFCVAGEDVNGMEIINTPSLQADESRDIKTSGKVWINSPVLHMEEQVINRMDSSGEFLDCTYTFTQTQKGCVARDVTFSQVFDPGNIRLKSKTLTIQDETGKEIKGDLQRTGNNFQISTGKNLGTEEEYQLWDGTNQVVEQTLKNPLDSKAKTQVTIHYLAEVQNTDGAQGKVIGQIQLDSREKLPVKEEKKITTPEPTLDIHTETNQDTYESGSIAYVKVRITQKEQGATAQSIEINSRSLEEGASYVTDSIQVCKNGKRIHPKKITQEKDRFSLDTGENLKETDLLEVYYQMVFDDPRLSGNDCSIETAVVGTNAKEAQNRKKISVKQQESSNTQEKKQAKITIVPANVELAGTRVESNGKILFFLLILVGGLGTTLLFLRSVHPSGKVDHRSIAKTGHNKDQIS